MAKYSFKAIPLGLDLAFTLPIENRNVGSFLFKPVNHIDGIDYIDGVKHRAILSAMKAYLSLTIKLKDADMQEKLYTVAELAKIFGKSRQAIHNWLEAGRFPNNFEVGEGGGKMFLVPASDVE